MTDQRLEQIVAFLLRMGVALSAAIILLGGICYLVHHGGEAPAYAHFAGEPDQYTRAAAIAAAAVQRNCRAVIQLGLLVLIATPIARVAFSIAAFALEKDRTYVIVTTIVLSILMYSLIGQR
jgi:uncharacterized membrane protein